MTNLKFELEKNIPVCIQSYENVAKMHVTLTIYSAQSLDVIEH